MEVNSADRPVWTVGDLTVSTGGQVMRVAAIGAITTTLVVTTDPQSEPEHALTAALTPMPSGAETITCLGCLRNTHLWIDATHTHRPSGRRTRLIRCSRCFVDALDCCDCKIHTISISVRPHHLARRR
ncbi:hypothetical protein LDL08_19850 [Nonomuraea glycinis]|uniref:Uncharacterized protein n=1 Tax=Nonomuraea glycinis TaxID=2047744 RepID=A0A918AAN2_9ACTN|nr:hypothetical protein [Nonomuraea glycinis]MCA2178446.1 hypothetical protein [Nonomuraea glycinis]GGP12247.1 hypothetical protein GCM10012278_59230 [Nonomuraea glycinis]